MTHGAESLQWGLPSPHRRYLLAFLMLYGLLFRIKLFAIKGKAYKGVAHRASQTQQTRENPSERLGSLHPHRLFTFPPTTGPLSILDQQKMDLKGIHICEA